MREKITKLPILHLLLLYQTANLEIGEHAHLSFGLLLSRA